MDSAHRANCWAWLSAVDIQVRSWFLFTKWVGQMSTIPRFVLSHNSVPSERKRSMTIDSLCRREYDATCLWRNLTRQDSELLVYILKVKVVLWMLCRFSADKDIEATALWVKFLQFVPLFTVQFPRVKRGNLVSKVRLFARVGQSLTFH